MQENAIHWETPGTSRIPFALYTNQDSHKKELERFFYKNHWSYVGLEAEIPKPGDFKRSYVGETPVVMTRAKDGELAAWVNRCSHRGAEICRKTRGNSVVHTCVYHQWSFSAKGDLQGVPFRRGQRDQTGMPPDFDVKDHGLRKLRVESYRGLVFGSFSETVAPLADYIGPQMRPYIDRIFNRPIEYLGCTRQFSNSNWKLYMENVKDPYHASLLHLFHTTFNILRVGMKATTTTDATGLHSALLVVKNAEDNAEGYKAQNIRTYQDGFRLEDSSVLDMVQEYEELSTNHIQPIFPQLVIQQIHNTLVARQLIAKAHDKFELVFHFFGYADDTPQLRAMRIKQANLVGPAGYISMEDTEATELVQRGITGHGRAASIVDMSRHKPDETATMISEGLVRRFWEGYRQLMGFAAEETP